MTAIPLPFVLAFVLVVLSLQLARAQPGLLAARPLRWLLGACVLQAVLVGLRWSLDTRAVLSAMAVTSAAVPPLAWLTLRETASARLDRRHALAPLLVAALVLVWPAGVDITIFAIYATYLWALYRLLRSDEVELAATPFGAIAPKRTVIAVAMAVLAAMTLIDAGIALDFALNDGAAAGRIVMGVNVLTIAGIAIVMVRLAAPPRGAPAGDTTEDDSRAFAAPGTIEPDEDALALVRKVDALLVDDALYRDPSLGLATLAKRAGRSARELSAAINQVRGKNVSRYVNDHRVAAACAALEETSEPVTNIMFDAGFQTKSNFNREFRRVTGMSPVQFRQARRGT